MKRRLEEQLADRAWDQMVERVDGVETDAQELARVEALLARGEDAPVRAEWIEATVAKVTAPAPVEAAAVGKVLPLRGGSWLKRIAAVLLGHWLITASASAAVAVAVTLILWHGQRSVLNLTHTNAYRLLLDTEEDLDMRRSALIKVHSVASEGIQVMQLIRDNPQSPLELQGLAAERLTYLQAVLDVAAPPAPQLVDDAARQALLAASAQRQITGDDLDYSSLCVEGRWISLWYTAGLAESAILAIRAVRDDEALKGELKYPMRHLGALLRR